MQEVYKLLENIEELIEANPWHDAQGRFAKGGKKTAVMYSLYGKKKYLTKKKKKDGAPVFAKKQKGWKRMIRNKLGRFTKKKPSLIKKKKSQKEEVLSNYDMLLDKFRM